MSTMRGMGLRRRGSRVLIIVPLALHWPCKRVNVGVKMSAQVPVRNLLMVPSERGEQVFKATKLAEVSEIRDEEEEPQCDGRGEDGQGNNLEGSNDGEMCTRSIEEGGSRPVLCSSQMDSLGPSRQFNSPYIHNICLYICNSINKSLVSIWFVHRVCALPRGLMTSLRSR